MSQNDVQGQSQNQSQAQNQSSDVQGMESSGETHKLSIALTIGATIGLIGLILLLYGLFGDANYSRSDGINVNLWWGLVMVVFGILMSGLNLLSTRMHAARANK